MWAVQIEYGELKEMEWGFEWNNQTDRVHLGSFELKSCDLFLNQLLTQLKHRLHFSLFENVKNGISRFDGEKIDVHSRITHSVWRYNSQRSMEFPYKRNVAMMLVMMMMMWSMNDGTLFTYKHMMLRTKITNGTWSQPVFTRNAQTPNMFNSLQHAYAHSMCTLLNWETSAQHKQQHFERTSRHK